MTTSSPIPPVPPSNAPWPPWWDGEGNPGCMPTCEVVHRGDDFSRLGVLVCRQTISTAMPWTVAVDFSQMAGEKVAELRRQVDIYVVAEDLRAAHVAEFLSDVIEASELAGLVERMCIQ